MIINNYPDSYDSFEIISLDTGTGLYGAGTTSDNWFVKIWIVAKFPKIIFSTYQSEKKTSEVKKVDRIIDSFQFIM